MSDHLADWPFSDPTDPAVAEAWKRYHALQKQGLHRSGVWGRLKSRTPKKETR